MHVGVCVLQMIASLLVYIYASTLTSTQMPHAFPNIHPSTTNMSRIRIRTRSHQSQIT